MIIAIDGPAGTGKSTVALKVAKELGYFHLDTGALYRAITYAAIYHGIETKNQDAIEQFVIYNIPSIQFFNDIPRYLVGNIDTTDFIRSQDVTQHVSLVSSYPRVRHVLIEVQRRLAQGINVVCEGRDMGTNVFPHAEVKIFLTANPQTRAERRFKEIKSKNPLSPETTFESILEEVMRRDHMDSTRTINPLQVADGAHVIDTSNLTQDEVIRQVLRLAREAIEKK